MKSLVNSQNAEDESFEVQLKMLQLSTCLQIILVSRAGELDRGCTRACAASLAAEALVSAACGPQAHSSFIRIRAWLDASAELLDIEDRAVGHFDSVLAGINVNFAAHELPQMHGSM